MSFTDIPTQNTPFALQFHPTEKTIYTALLTGEIKAFSYSYNQDTEGEEEGGTVVEWEESWEGRIGRKSARALCMDEEGKRLWCAGKEKGLHAFDTATGSLILSLKDAHEVPINRMICLDPNMLVTGDDDGIIKLWDPRQKPHPTAVRQYTHHTDYISSFLSLTHLTSHPSVLCTSSDAFLSVIDLRSSKSVISSELQEDELLSSAAIKEGKKVIVGTGEGAMLVFDSSKGWGDCMDRVVGCPGSVESIIPLSDDIIATGSSDGLVRIISILPTKFMGVIASHTDEYPIEHLALSSDNQVLASASHDDVIKMTWIGDIFEDSDDEEDEDESGDKGEMDGIEESVAGEEEEEVDSDDEDEKRKMKKKEKKKKKNKMNPDDVDKEMEERMSFFDDL